MNSKYVNSISPHGCRMFLKHNSSISVTLALWVLYRFIGISILNYTCKCGESFLPRY